MTETLDMRTVACPTNFVRSKIKLDSMEPGEELEILLDDGEPIESVSKSLTEEGHQIKSKEQVDNYWNLVVKKTV